MTESICNQGHVIDPGLLNCSRCGGSAIGTAEVAPVINEAPVAEDAATVDLETLTKKEIEVALEKLGVDFKTSESKADLLEKLQEAVAADAEEEAEAEAEAEDESDEDDL